jgi:hypothetical protein
LSKSSEKKINSGKSRNYNICYDFKTLKIHCNLPDNYPLNINSILSYKITFEKMKMAVEMAYQKLISKKWGVGQTRSYLRPAGVSKSVVDKLIKLSKLDEGERDLNSIVPPMWFSKLSVDAFIEAPMYLLFLGVTKTVGFVLKTLLTTYKSYAVFHKFHHALDNVRAMALGWCKTLVFGSHNSPFGPWMSENYVGFACVFKLVYFSLRIILENITNGEELLNSIFFLVTARNSLITRLMQRVVNAVLITDIERHIKIFLR